MFRKPEPSEVMQAVGIYLGLAYQDWLPSAVRDRLQTLRSLPADEIYNNQLMEGKPKEAPVRYSIRLGNQKYPHMKMTIEQSPDGRGYFYRADTHDQHICPPPSSREYAAFTRMMKENQLLAQAIEQKWAEAGLPTFKQYLRQDLRRRQTA